MDVLPGAEQKSVRSRSRRSTRARAIFWGTFRNAETPVKQVVGSIGEGLSNFFQIPDGYEVVLGNGGASAFWDTACAAAYHPQGGSSARTASS